ncbi:MaoC/PaaZ C-terminal domain-containing protein [Microbacterium sp. X-17]|uniref:MaoC/PaaZ C-terminal domain-containing protein n=1 Tax=Microbacterium sp. X-17 TaxID=3144404 RepID=UPI0031F5313F
MKAGDVLPAITIDPISRKTLALYAGASGDHNPMHIDLDEARAFGFDDVFVHGMLSMAYLGRVLTDRFPQDRIRSFSVRFTSITPVHGQPTCVARVTEVADGLARLELESTLPDGTVTLRGTAVVATE